MQALKAVWGVIPAAGSATRFGAAVPKQFLQLAGRSVLEHSVRALLRSEALKAVMIAAESAQTVQSVIDLPALEREFGKSVWLCPGGATRAQSVLNALLALQLNGVPDAALVAVHDAARPGLNLQALSAVLAAAASHPDGAILALPVRDSVKYADASGRIERSLDRSHIWCAQTPQVFGLAALVAALRRAPESTDEAQAMELAGFTPKLVHGHASNLKITVAEDMPLMEYFFGLLRESSN